MSKKHRVVAAAATGSSAATVHTAEPEALTVAELTSDEIAARAYSYWEKRGFQGGSPEDDWSRAIEELTAERNRQYAS